MLRDLHVHTTFSDGKATPEELIKHALEIGMDCIGFSDHSHSPQPGGERWTMPLNRKADYLREIDRLKQAYRSQITVLCGIEQDLYSDSPTDGYDYIIGSVHFIRLPGEGERCMQVDQSPETLQRTADEYFGGDLLSLCEAYFDQVGSIPERMSQCSIVGHFDLIALFGRKLPCFDETHPRYVAAWQRAVDRLLEMGIPFELNLGAIARGYSEVPYPAAPIREYIRAKGGRLVLSSDAHRPEMLCWGFDAWQQELC